MQEKYKLKQMFTNLGKTIKFKRYDPLRRPFYCSCGGFEGFEKPLLVFYNKHGNVVT